jgi:hypothetical protein
MKLSATDAQVEEANRLIGDTPMVVGKRIMARIENERRLPRGCISSSRLRTKLIVEARHDAVAELYQEFLKKGKRLSPNLMERIFHLDTSTICSCLNKRGLLKSNIRSPSTD